MSIYGVSHNSTYGTVSFKSREEDNVDINSEEGARVDRDGDGKPDTLDGVTITSTSRKLAEVTAQYPHFNVVDTMGADLQLLKEQFMETLENRLQDAGVNVEQAFTLQAGEDGTVQVTGAHPDKAAIEAIINTDEQLSAAFGQIVDQGKLVDTVAGNNRYRNLRKGLEVYQQSAQGKDDGSLGAYLVSLSDRSMQSTLADYL